MILTTREDIDAPAEAVFAALTYFEGFERAAMRRGAEVTRADLPRAVLVGRGWRIRFDYRGKRRDLTAAITAHEAPNGIAFDLTGKTANARLAIDLLALSLRRTRVTVTLEIMPITLGARIFVQSMKLTRKRVNDRFAKRVKLFATTIDDKLRKPGIGSPQL